LPVEDEAGEDAARVVVENAVDGSRIGADGGVGGPGEVLADRSALVSAHVGLHEERFPKFDDEITAAA
jgi:hypothetical protein